MISQVLSRAIWDSEWASRVPCGGFRHLKTLEWTSVKDARYRKSRPNTLTMLPFLHLPALRSLSVSIDNLEGPGSLLTTGRKWFHGGELTQLRSLTITVLREAGLEEMLKLMPRLEKLSWERTFCSVIRPDNVADSVTVDLTRIIAALSPVRHTLKELTISTSTQTEEAAIYAYVPSPYRPPFARIAGSMQDLTSFDKLVKLTAPLCFLMGSMMCSKGYRDSVCLPKNIESLIRHFRSPRTGCQHV